ncbi:uncharacterized protein LOC107882256 [Acyrthosiphon pisum]|uniref:Zinc finger PHD-type domain-containing protein n=1 Tax=Acyrthosiphon pisum TaxID=7029 RepID=A0A8R2D0V5_ACYPI|nr:uncharacterized protein LOC107882256 [Acyrthosiphon pisum]|eukprot:XP_016655856.1 PREDICTED: uncharacterized protein LOC107882256 [Acyrthosiphon pisum]
MIKPLPKALPRKTTRRGRQPGKTKILTKTPDKLDVSQESLSQSEQNGKKKIIKTNKNQKSKVRKQVLQSSDSDSEREEETTLIQYSDSADGPSEDLIEIDEHWYCFVCKQDEILDMRLCINCKRYVHEICVGLTKNDTDPFICCECE